MQEQAPHSKPTVKQRSHNHEAATEFFFATFSSDAIPPAVRRKKRSSNGQDGHRLPARPPPSPLSPTTVACDSDPPSGDSGDLAPPPHISKTRPCSRKMALTWGGSKPYLGRGEWFHRAAFWIGGGVAAVTAVSYGSASFSLREFVPEKLSMSSREWQVGEHSTTSPWPRPRFLQPLKSRSRLGGGYKHPLTYSPRPVGDAGAWGGLVGVRPPPTHNNTRAKKNSFGAEGKKND